MLNSSGETYASSAHIFDFEDEPDLIAAAEIDGKEGYVKKTIYMKICPNHQKQQ